MLILKLVPGGSIVLTGGIRVVVTEVGRGHVKLGVTAPTDVKIFRENVVGGAPPELVAMADAVQPYVRPEVR